MARFPAADWKRSPRSERRDGNQAHTSRKCQRLTFLGKTTHSPLFAFCLRISIETIGEIALILKFLLIGSRLSSQDYFSIVRLMFFPDICATADVKNLNYI